MFGVCTSIFWGLGCVHTQMSPIIFTFVYFCLFRLRPCGLAWHSSCISYNNIIMIAKHVFLSHVIRSGIGSVRHSMITWSLSRCARSTSPFGGAPDLLPSPNHTHQISLGCSNNIVLHCDIIWYRIIHAYPHNSITTCPIRNPRDPACTEATVWVWSAVRIYQSL